MSQLPTEPSALSLTQAAALIRTRALSPVELVDAVLGRAKRLNEATHSYLTLCEEAARAAARRAEVEIQAGRYRGPLHGLPYAAKDIFWTAGVPTTAHSRLAPRVAPGENAAAIDRLEAAGAILLGKTALYEYALGTPDLDTAYPPALNPWDLARTPGGSSSGSASAVSSGAALAALGSDTGGSIRIPASFSGLVGMKPTTGLVSRYGVVPLSGSLDTVGPLTRTVADNALLLDALAGQDPRDPASQPRASIEHGHSIGQSVEGLRLGVPEAELAAQPDLDPAVRALFHAACATLGRLGARLVPVRLPWSAEAEAVTTAIMLSEAYAYHAPTLQRSPQLYAARFRQRLLVGGLITASDYLQALQLRHLTRVGHLEVLGEVDAILTPTTPWPAPTMPETREQKSTGNPRFTRLFNLSGLPALSVPCGFTDAGLPTGLQITTRPFAEDVAYQLGAAYEAATAWLLRRPPLPAGS